jgi:essential nuclear protein 1
LTVNNTYKMSKATKSKSKQQRHDPLYDQIRADQIETKGIKKRVVDKKDAKKVEKPNYLPKELSQKLLKQVRKQQEEEEDNISDDEPINNKFGKYTAAELDSDQESADDSDDEAFKEEYDEDVEEIEVDPEDERVMAAFNKPQATERRSLADIIMEKIKEKEQQLELVPKAMPGGAPVPTINPKIIDVYTQVGEIMRNFTAGKVPKAFKIIPSLTNWEEVLYYTHPENWSASGVRVATKIFASNFNAKMAQRYYFLVLLPRIRDDILNNKKLNWHLYMSLKKALFKPDAFYKGILFPLIESGDCTLREAVIVGSVLRRVSVPVLHSAVALLKLAEMEYSGATSIFMKILLDKKYALPFRVVDAIVEHFASFTNDRRELPILWHQCVLIFAQRYKTDLTPEQKEKLKHLLRNKYHHGITPEIRRELFSSKCRNEDETMDVDGAADMID